MKKLALLISVVVLVLLVVAAVVLDGRHPKERGVENISSDSVSVQLKNKEGILVKEAVIEYLSADMLNVANEAVRPSDFAGKKNERLDVQLSVILEMDSKNKNAAAYKVELADNAKFNNAKIYYVEVTDSACEFEYLYANTEYFYRVTAYTENGLDYITGSFRTADTPRILSIEGTYNVRDIGNWQTDSGKRIRQGLLIRGTELDGAVESAYSLSNKGLCDMLGILGIKMDMDLRAQTDASKDALGSRVTHKYYDMVFYGDIFTEAGKEKVKAVFVDFANPDNYPIYLHCTYGCDRTGVICYLLEALLGVSREDCRKEYGLSNLYIADILVVENGLGNYSGDTLKEQVESYLISCGVTKQQIKSIRNIFLGD